MIWPSRGIVFVASNKSTWTASLRSGSGLLLVSASNAALDSHSIVFARRRRKIRSTASASSAMRGWLWSSVKRFRQHASEYILTYPLCRGSQHALNDSTHKFADLRVPNLWSGNRAAAGRPPESLTDEVPRNRARFDQIENRQQRASEREALSQAMQWDDAGMLVRRKSVGTAVPKSARLWIPLKDTYEPLASWSHINKRQQELKLDTIRFGPPRTSPAQQTANRACQALSRRLLRSKAADERVDAGSDSKRHRRRGDCRNGWPSSRSGPPAGIQRHPPGTG